MKKKILALLVMLFVVVPVVVVNAASYEVFQFINFLPNAADEAAYKDGNYSVGFGTYYLGTTDKKDDKGNSYLKVLSAGLTGSTSIATHGVNYKDEVDGIYKKYMAEVAAPLTAPYAYTESDKVVVDLITKDEAVAAFNAGNASTDTNGNETYTIALNDNVKNMLQYLTINDANTSYIATSTNATTPSNEAGYDYYYAIKVTKDGAGNITAASIEAINGEGFDSQGTGAMIYGGFVLLMNEGYTCKEDTDDNYACYSCPTDSNTTEYVWKASKNVDSKCTIVKTVGSKAKCVKNVKTGVESYLAPAAIVLGVCAIVLTVVKRKDAFRAI